MTARGHLRFPAHPPGDTQEPGVAYTPYSAAQPQMYASSNRNTCTTAFRTSTTTLIWSDTSTIPNIRLVYVPTAPSVCAGRHHDSTPRSNHLTSQFRRCRIGPGAIPPPRAENHPFHWPRVQLRVSTTRLLILCGVQCGEWGRDASEDTGLPQLFSLTYYYCTISIAIYFVRTGQWQKKP